MKKLSKHQSFSKSALSVSTGENVCVMSKIAKEVSEITDTFCNIRKKSWQKPSKLTKPAALSGYHKKKR